MNRARRACFIANGAFVDGSTVQGGRTVRTPARWLGRSHQQHQT